MKGWSYRWCWTMRRVTGLMRRSTGRLSWGRSRDTDAKRERSRLLKEETKCEGSHRWIGGTLGSRQRCAVCDVLIVQIPECHSRKPTDWNIKSNRWMVLLALCFASEHHYCFLYSYCSPQIVSSCSSFLWNIDKDPQYCTWLAQKPEHDKLEPNMSLRRWKRPEHS